MPRSAHTVLSCGTLVAVISLAAPCAAEPIPVTITAGTLAMQGGGGQLSLVGDHGFTYNGGVGVTGGIFGPFETCLSCLPGETLSLFAFWGGNDLQGTATFEGITYEHVGDLQPGHAVGSVTFLGSAAVPPLLGLTTVVIAPFLFEGQFSFPSPAAVATLSGGGLATVTLRRSTSDIPWSYQSAVYEFAPVPELGTMTLVGSSLVALLLRRRRNQ